MSQRVRGCRYKENKDEKRKSSDESSSSSSSSSGADNVITSPKGQRKVLAQLKNKGTVDDYVRNMKQVRDEMTQSNPNSGYVKDLMKV